MTPQLPTHSLRTPRWGLLLAAGLLIAGILWLAGGFLARGVLGEPQTETEAGGPPAFSPSLSPAENPTGALTGDTAPLLAPSTLEGSDLSASGSDREDLGPQAMEQAAEPPAVENDPADASDPMDGPGARAVFRIEPLAAPCCPLPTTEKAVEAAQAVSGVLGVAAGDGILQVRYDPDQVSPEAIAAAVNRASFIVEIRTEEAP